MSVPALLLFSADGKSHITGIDWLAIALYFGILLGVAWWVVRKGKDSAADYFLAGRNLGWWIIGASIFASNIGSEHIVGLAGSGRNQRRGHGALRIARLVPVGAGLGVRSVLHAVHGVHHAGIPGAAVQRQIALHAVDRFLITFVISKIAVGIFAGGVVFGTLLPEMHLNVGGMIIDSFWIGSVLVIVLTGLYTTLGGMRAVAYNDAVQVSVLIVGSALLTVYGLVQLGGWSELRHWCGSDMFNLWKPLIPAGVRGHLGAGDRDERGGQRSSRRPGTSTGTFPGWACCSARRSSGFGTGARTSTSCSGHWARRTKPWPAAAAFSPRFSSYSRCTCFIIPGLICFALAKSGKVPELGADDRAGRPGHSVGLERRFSDDGAVPVAAGHYAASSWPGCSPH